jgi:RHS repeat-associated protein
MTYGADFTNLGSIQARTITYNSDNMPTQISHSSNITTQLTYGGTGERVKKRVYSGGNVTDTYYIGDHFEVKGGVTIKYIFAGNLRVAQVKGTTRSFFHKDHLGSSTVMTNASGAELESTEYLPFGSQRSHSGTSTSDYRYTDQELDAENGLYNYNARLYDPFIGRFISPDTIVQSPYNPQSLNRYTYCFNNPLIYVDPSGHISFQDIVDWLKGVLGWGSVPPIPDIGYTLTFCPFEDDEGNTYGSGTTFYMGVSNPITPSNYDPNNTDPVYIENAIQAGKHYLLAKTGVDTLGIESPYVNADGAKAHVRDDNGKTEIFNSAFSGSLADLASTIGHEKVHHDQWWGGKGILPPGNERIRLGTEVVALDWQVANAAKLGLDVKPFQERRDNTYNNLSPGVRRAYDNEEYNPYKKND